jgi:hypothetical protein
LLASAPAFPIFASKPAPTQHFLFYGVGEHFGEASCISRLAISTATCTVLARVKRSPVAGR